MDAMNEIDLTAAPSADIASLASLVADLALWLCDVEERLASIETNVRTPGGAPVDRHALLEMARGARLDEYQPAWRF